MSGILLVVSSNFHIQNASHRGAKGHDTHDASDIGDSPAKPENNSRPETLSNPHQFGGTAKLNSVSPLNCYLCSLHFERVPVFG